MFYIIAKFQENPSTQFVLKCKSGKNFADFTIFSCVSSHISTLTHRNFMKLTQQLCLIMFYIIAKFQENPSTQFVLKCKSGKNFADFTIFSCVSSHISTLTHRNFTKLTQQLCLIMFYIIAKFQENPSTQFVLKCKSGKNFADFTIFSCVSSHISTLTHRNFTKLTQQLCLIMFYIIAKFQENLSTQFVLKCKSGKNFADFTIFSCVSSHISTLTHRNFTKLTQQLCLIMFYIIAKFQENPSTQFVLKCKSGKNFADFTIFSCVSSHISTLTHRNFTKLTQQLCLIMFYIIAKFQENLSTQFVLKCKSGKNFADFTIFSCVSSHISTLTHRNFTKLTQQLCLIMFYIIAKFQENLSTQFVLKCKSGKNFADFTIFSCVSSHISTLTHRNFTKLTQQLCLIMFYIIAKFQENPSTQFVLKCKSGKNFADFTIFSCVSSHISTLTHRNFTKLTQQLCLIMFYIIAKFQENLSTQFVLKCKSGKNFADFTIFSCVSSHISTLTHRNFTKLTQQLCIIMFYIIAKFQENLSTQFVLKCKSGKNFADFTIFSCVSSHISTLTHRNFTKLTQQLCLIMFYIIAKFQENPSTQFVLKCKSGKNFADFTIFSCVSSHISTLTHRNFTKLTQQLCLIMFYIIAKFQENLSTQFVLKCKSGKNLAKIWQKFLKQPSYILVSKFLYLAMTPSNLKRGLFYFHPEA